MTVHHTHSSAENEYRQKQIFSWYPVLWCTDNVKSLLYMASPTSCSGAYRPYRMLQHAWSPAPEGATTSQFRSVLQKLHWLPVRQRAEFKLAVLVYKALNNLAPPYLSPQRTAIPFFTFFLQLPACCRHRAPSASIIRQFQVHHHWYQFTSWRSSIRCCLTTPLEQTVFLLMSVDLISPWTPSATNWKRI